MKRSRKVLSFLTAAAMLGGVAVPAEPLAQLGAVMMVRAEDESTPTSGTCGENLTWEYDASTKTLTISGTGEMEDYYDDIPWLSYVGDIEHVNIEKGVTSISAYAFDSCGSLTSVTISDSVTSIDYSAFAYCSSLTSVTIPDSVTDFGGYAFYKTPWLEEQLALSPYVVVNHIVISSDSETCIGDLVIPNGVTSIAERAFEGSPYLTSVTIPDSVTSIGGYAFLGCTRLTSVTIPNSVTSIGNFAFEFCESLTSVTIPNGVTSIGGYAFWGCVRLTSVTIPNSVTSIGNFAFGYCDLTSVTIPDSVTSIGDCAFEDCYSLTSVTIPGSVKNIGDDAFRYCSDLTSVTIPDSVTSIGEGAFEECSSLTSIVIENPDCEIDDDPSTISNEFVNGSNGYIDGHYTFTGTIYGYDNSTAQAYAEKYGRTFKSLGPAPAHPADTLGDVSGDNVINAGDAAVTLSAAAAYGATGSYGDMTAAQIAAADIDGNSMVNASDAAYILQYAAMRGANGKDFDIRELVK